MYEQPSNASGVDHPAGSTFMGPGTRGCWCFVASPAGVGALARAGFDWVALDAQHGEFDRRGLRKVGGSLAAAGHKFAVRVSSVDAAEIGFALDVGASAVIVPQVNNADEAKLAVEAAHYPPLGARSWGPMAPLWGLEAPSATAATPRLAVMIESAAGLANVEAIAHVTGVDQLFVGPVDLALSLGVPLEALLRNNSSPLQAIVRAARLAGIDVGSFAGTPARALQLREAGIECLAVTTDAAVVAAGASALLSDIPAGETRGG